MSRSQTATSSASATESSTRRWSRAIHPAPTMPIRIMPTPPPYLSAESHGDGVEGQPHARSHHGAVDADVLQVASEEQFQLTRRLRGIPPLDGPGDKTGELVVELVGE